MIKIIHKYRCYFAFSMVLFILAGCNSTHSSQMNELKTCEENQVCKVDESKKMSFVDMEMEQALEFFENKETGILYFGYDECPWCQQASPILNEISIEKKQEINHIRIVNASHERLYTDEQNERLSLFISDYMTPDEHGAFQLYVPLVLSVKDGKVMNGHIGTFENHNANTREMTEKEKEQLKSIYEKLINDIS
ncbi:transporter accessory protein [[Clostridium] innocuum]|nr:transporter accessory protein [[Clostridium] innocuum]